MPEKEGAEEKSTKSVVNKKQKQMMGEEGYDHLRDMGRIRKNKKKKDATTLPVSDEVKKTQKVNKGPSALELVKKKYKGQIMDVKKEELDLTQVAEAFGGYIIEAPVDSEGNIKPKTGDAGRERRLINKEIRRRTAPKPGDIEAEKRILDARLNKKAAGDVGADALLDKIKEKPKVRSARRRTPSKKLADIKKGINIKNPTVVGKTGGKIPLKLGSKKAVQSALKTGTKTAVKRATAKGAGKLVAKRVPGVGAAIAGAETIGRAAKGDYVGAAIAGAETIANILPGVQHTIGTGLAGINMARDIRRASRTAGTIKKTIQTAKTARKVKKVGSTAANVGPRITTSGGKVKSFVKTPRKIKKTLPKTDTAYSPPARGKIGKAIFGRTKLGRGVRGLAVGQEFLPGGGIVRRAIKGLVGGAKKAVDGSHVGRRTAG